MNIHFSLILRGVFTLTVCWWLTSCEKWNEDDEKTILLNGDTRLKGEVYLNNITTGILDTAYKAEIRLYRTGHPDKALLLNLTKGTFEINNLGKGSYTLEARLDQRPAPGAPAIVYKYRDDALTLTDDEQRLDMRLQLEPDLTLLADPAVKLTVVDSNGNLRPNARVCLFAEQSILMQNFRRCTGSLRTGITNNRGIVVFTGLQAKTYYATAFAPNGRDSLTNVLGSQPSSIGPLTTAGMSQELVVTQSSIPAPAAVAPGLRLTIVDENNIVLPATRVCLYPALSYVTSSGLDCISSLRSDSTDTQGQVTFTNLQAGTTYYVKAVKIIGTSILTNLSVGSLKAVSTNSQGIKTETITIKP